MKFYIVDVFAAKKYSGNQLGVFILDERISDKQMLKIANEFNFSEVTFIDAKNADQSYIVRIFTPDREIPFAGHPTLGTSFVINEILENAQLDEVVLDLLVGKIPVKIDKTFYEMTQNQPTFGRIYSRELMADLVNLKKKDISKEYPCQFVSTGLGSVIIPVKNKKALKKAAVNHKNYRKFIKKHGDGNLLLFTKDGEDIDVRVFVDDLGFGEDPATGSANGNLAAYILQRHYLSDGDEVEYKVHQGAEIGRPSELFIKASKNGEFDIKVGGHVFFIAQGTWNV